MGRGIQVSPWVFEAFDYLGKAIRITVVFNDTTKTLQSGTVFRDAGCVYTRVYIGVGADGAPDTSVHKFIVPAGTSEFTSAQLSMVGLTSILDILLLQITAGP
ncbi:MAG: hypothetical protein ACRDQX_13870 [Pseudonocardiaceae bacterium]